MNAINPFYGARSARGPAQNSFPIAPADNMPLSCPTSAIFVGGAGNVAVYLEGDVTSGIDPYTGVTAAPRILSNVPAGTWLPLCVKIVMATGTSATNILGLV